MRCTCYRVDPPALVAALTDGENLARYQAAIGDEVPSLADRAMVLHLRRMSTLASRVASEGFERVAEQDPALADALLTDLFAVATYRGWELPAEDLGARELPIAGLPRGLMGADAAIDGAQLWLIDPGTIALARSREAADQADMSGYVRGA